MYQPAPAQAAARPATCTVNAQSGWSPCNLQSAYKISSLISTHGNGQTIAVVDAYDDPNAEADLATYRSNFGLPPAPPSTGASRRSTRPVSRATTRPATWDGAGKGYDGPTGLGTPKGIGAF